MNDGVKSTGAVALVASGIASAFALATCCAFPILFGSAAVVFAPIAVATEPHSQLLTAISAIGLIGSIGVAARAPRHCKPNAVCARPWFRWSIIAAAVLGAVVLIAAKYYA
jgi:mercuric ion transport protein